jgi:hypothetical protein
MVFMHSNRYYFQILMEVEFYGQIFKNTSNFIKIGPVGAEFFSTRTDRQDEANTRISHFCERI